MSAAVHDLNREVSLQLLRSVRAFAIRTPRGQKEPGHFKWDPRTNNKTQSDQIIFDLERSDDNLGVHLFGPVVDVDIDSDNPHLIPALDYFLPPTAHVWGRKSRPRTHRLYELSGAKAEFDPKMFPFLETIQKFESIAVEVRGGQMRNGEYSLLPGSLHPSGEAYEWDDLRAARSTPVTVDIHRIVNAVRYACVVAAIAPYWTEGSRNTLCMALSGFFHRASKHVEEMGSASNFEFGMTEAKDLLSALLSICDDDPSDRIMRMKTFDQTWEKAESGVAVSGATTIEKITGNTEIVSVLYTLLADSPDMVELDQFMERYAIRNNSSTIIDIEKAGSKKTKYVMTMVDHTNSTMHKTIKNAGGGKTPMSAILQRSKRAIRVEGLAFVPEEEKLIHREDGIFVNQWTGWAIPMDPEPVASTDVVIFLRYIEEVVANGDREFANWIYAWLADIIQKPAGKCGTALVLVGPPGAGKTMLGEKIMGPIIGETHSSQINSIETLTGNFNSDTANLLFMQCDEAMNSRRRQDANRLKAMITDHWKRTEFKFADAFRMEDYCRYLFTSNDEEDAVAIIDGEADRRYTVGAVNPAYAYKSDKPDADKRAFWDEMFKFLEVKDKVPNKENLAKIHRWLYDFKYDPALIRAPYVTAARRVMAQHSQRGLDDWLMEISTMPHPFVNLREDSQQIEDSFIKRKKAGKEELFKSYDGWPDMVNYQRVQDSYDLYRRRKGMAATTPTYNVTQIKQAFVKRKILKHDHNSARVRGVKEEWIGGELRPRKTQIYVHDFPTKEDIQRYLVEQYGFSAVQTNDVTDMIDGSNQFDNETGLEKETKF